MDSSSSSTKPDTVVKVEKNHKKGSKVYTKNPEFSNQDPSFLLRIINATTLNNTQAGVSENVDPKNDIEDHPKNDNKDLNLTKTQKTLKNFTCEKCPASFSIKSRLANHIKIHTGEKPYRCKKCGKAFKSDESCKHHYKNFHTSFKMKCEYCDKVYKSRSGLWVHYNKEHSDERKEKKDNTEKDA